MKTFVKVFFLAVVLIASAAALAHDGWIEVAPALVEKGQPVTIALMQDNH